MISGAAILLKLRALPWGKIAPLAAILAAMMALTVTRCQRDKAVADAVVSKAEAITNGQSVVVLERARAADSSADIARQADTARLDVEARQLKDTSHALPDQPLSARARARLERVRQQQGRDALTHRRDPASD